RVILIEGAPRVLGAFPPDLSNHAEQALKKLGVDVSLNATVTGCDASGVVLGAERIEARTIIWAAGVQSSPAARWLNAAADRAGRVQVGADLRPPGTDNVFVIGDCATAAGADGKPLPGVAPVAKQQGAYAAEAIKRMISSAPAQGAFRYRDYG